MTLAHDLLIAPGAQPDRSIAFLHGLLGTAANWRTIARKFVEARPQWAAVLVDLRRHGRSLDAPGPDTLERAAQDVAELAALQSGRPVRAVLGHSFGGKVGLQWVHDARGAGLEDLFVIDSTPSARPGRRGVDSTLQVLERLEAAADENFPTRDAFVQRLEALGQDRALSQWLAMNLRREEGGFRFGPPLAAIRALLDSYLAIDRWDVLERPPEGLRTHLVIGDRSDAFDAGDRTRAEKIAAQPGARLDLEVRPTGHWVHAEDPEGVLGVLVARLA